MQAVVENPAAGPLYFVCILWSLAASYNWFNWKKKHYAAVMMVLLCLSIPFEVPLFQLALVTVVFSGCVSLFTLCLV